MKSTIMGAALLGCLALAGCGGGSSTKAPAATSSTTAVTYGATWTPADKAHLQQVVSNDPEYFKFPASVRDCLVGFIESNWTPAQFHQLSASNDPSTLAALSAQIVKCG